MREVVSIDLDEVLPDASAVLESQGIPAGVDPGERTRGLLTDALDLLRECIQPVGVFAEVTGDEFTAVHRGMDRNAPETPLEIIYPRATRLALFAVTLGSAVGARIVNLFALKDFALGSMLDGAASEATEKAGDAVERQFFRRLKDEGISPETQPLRYSPGYCGWHLSGQSALFECLQPQEIGLSLRESFLMEPLKSMSGVLVAGPPRIHLFKPDYPFCESCRTHSCRPRMRAIMVHEQRGT
jgi:hypothetical protein